MVDAIPCSAALFPISDFCCCVNFVYDPRFEVPRPLAFTSELAAEIADDGTTLESEPRGSGRFPSLIVLGVIVHSHTECHVGSSSNYCSRVKFSRIKIFVGRLKSAKTAKILTHENFRLYGM